MSDPLAEYVIALTFSSRASSPYEVRGEAMASNMAHGITPEVVSRFRRAILEARINLLQMELDAARAELAALAKRE